MSGGFTDRGRYPILDTSEGDHTQPSTNTLHRTVMNTTDAQILRDMFTDAQWDAISSAMKDFADHGDEEATIADEIDAKIFSIFRVTE